MKKLNDRAPKYEYIHPSPAPTLTVNPDDDDFDFFFHQLSCYFFDHLFVQFLGYFFFKWPLALVLKLANAEDFSSVTIPVCKTTRGLFVLGLSFLSYSNQSIYFFRFHVNISIMPFMAFLF